MSKIIGQLEILRNYEVLIPKVVEQPIRLLFKLGSIVFGKIIKDEEFQSNLSRGYIRFIKNGALDAYKVANKKIETISKLYSISEIQQIVSYEWSELFYVISGIKSGRGVLIIPSGELVFIISSSVCASPEVGEVCIVEHLESEVRYSTRKSNLSTQTVIAVKEVQCAITAKRKVAVSSVKEVKQQLNLF